MTPEQIAKGNSERAQQVALFAWAALNTRHHPELKWMFAIPNGGSRGDTKRTAMIVGSQLKAEGVRAGVLDIFLPTARGGFHGLFIEMKRPARDGQTAGALSDEQAAFGEAMTQAGYKCVAAWTFQEARDLILGYLNPTRIDATINEYMDIVDQCSDALQRGDQATFEELEIKRNTLYMQLLANYPIR